MPECPKCQLPRATDEICPLCQPRPESQATKRRRLFSHPRGRSKSGISIERMEEGFRMLESQE